MAQLLGKVRRITAFFHRSSIASHTLKVKQKLLDLPSHKLKTNVVTRWNSALEMLERFLEQQPAISAELLSPEVHRSEKDLCTLSDADITAIEDVVKSLNPMKAATLAMSEKHSPTFSVIGPLHARQLQEMRIAPSDSTIIKDFKSTIHDNLMSRYVYRTFFNTAVLKSECSQLLAMISQLKGVLWTVSMFCPDKSFISWF